MANAVYPSAKQLILQGDIDFANDTFKVILIDTAVYTYSSAHDYLDDVAGTARIATSGALANPAVSAGGVFSADDLTISSVSGNTIEAIILYKESGSEGASPLIFYLDTDVPGLPITPTGGTEVIKWDPTGILILQ